MWRWGGWGVSRQRSEEGICVRALRALDRAVGCSQDLIIRCRITLAVHASRAEDAACLNLVLAFTGWQRKIAGGADA